MGGGMQGLGGVEGGVLVLAVGGGHAGLGGLGGHHGGVGHRLLARHLHEDTCTSMAMF